MDALMQTFLYVLHVYHDATSSEEGEGKPSQTLLLNSSLQISTKSTSANSKAPKNEQKDKDKSSEPNELRISLNQYFTPSMQNKVAGGRKNYELQNASKKKSIEIDGKKVE